MRLFLFTTLLLSFLTGYAQKQDIRQKVICEWEYQSRDADSGREKKALKAEKFFSYCPDGMDRFFIGKEYFECLGALSVTGGKITLNLTMKYLDKDISEQVGKIDPGASIEISSIRGKTLILKTKQGAIAEIKAHYTIYHCSFELSEKQIKSLKNFETDSVMISWSKGFQRYTVYYLDFFINQFNCLGY